jgi:aryl-alcohol dehydrogenase-like predicted oxidoreductase
MPVMTRPDPAAGAPLCKAIPSSGERLPVVGLGTNAFSLAGLEPLREALLRFTAGGASMLDTAAVYGESEQVIGRLVGELHLRSHLFIATKITSGPPSSANPQPGGLASFERSLERLQLSCVDLLYVHNMIGLSDLMPQILDWRRAGRLRYVGISTSRDEHHAAFIEHMAQQPLDFVQVNYGLGGRQADRPAGCSRPPRCRARRPPALPCARPGVHPARNSPGRNPAAAAPCAR